MDRQRKGRRDGRGGRGRETDFKPAERQGSAEFHVRPGTQGPARRYFSKPREEKTMHNIFYLIGVIVVILAVLSFIGLA